MRRFLASVSIVFGLSAVAIIGCGGEDGSPASLSLYWQLQDAEARTVLPSQAVQTSLVLRNDGDHAIDALQLRFDQEADGLLPLGLAVGTATNLSSRFEGNAQVWDLGTLTPGAMAVFPVTLWFDTQARTAEPLPVQLSMSAESPDLTGAALSNALEVEVDTRLATSQP